MRAHQETTSDTQVLIVGAGPVGLVLALELARRGVRAVLVEKNATSIQLPKMERCNARTMEIFRRLRIADDVRAAGLPQDCPMDIFLATSMSTPAAITHLRYPSVAEAKASIAGHNDGRPLEPYQLISQYTIEPLLRSFVARYSQIDVRFGCEMMEFEQDTDGVTATLQTAAGTSLIRAAYIVGCDGGASTVRKRLGIGLSGQGAIRKLRQALFYAPDLYDRIAMGKGRHYHIATGPIFPFIIVQDSTQHWTLHAAAETDDEMTHIFRDALQMDVPFDTLSVNEWTQHLLCATKYRDRRAFICGDAAHLVIPTGGLGMNMGVGDAVDLSWKLAGTLAGWGGPALLDSYEAERRQIGLRNVKVSGTAMNGRLSWRAQNSLDAMGRAFDTEQRKVTEILGIEAGYRYVESPVIVAEAGDAPDPDSYTYNPTTWPGARLPHVWLQDGTALHDHLGSGYTLLRLGESSPGVSALEHHLRAEGLPLDVVDVPDAAARSIYERDWVLVRPDLHVVWRGNQPPKDASSIARIASGNVATF